MSQPKVIQEFLKLAQQDKESFSCLLFTKKNQIISLRDIFDEKPEKESDDYCKKIAKEALKYNAWAAVIAHNHLNKITEPSATTIAIANKIKESLELVDMVLLDHFVISANSIFSFNEFGYF